MGKTHKTQNFDSSFILIKITPENPVLWTEIKGVSDESRKNWMLKRVQHDNSVWFLFFCHPEPGPELDSGSSISGS